MRYYIENDVISIAVDSKGAELQNLLSKETGLDYLWSGDEKFWAKHSPILFPIIGSLKGNSYEYEGRTYHLGRHGFARDMEFKLEAQTDDSLVFSLEDNEDTFLKYPFHFKLLVKYTLDINRLLVQYNVTNTGSGNMFFSVGAHPAFKVPLTPETTFEDYFLAFNKPEHAGIYPLSADGLTEPNPIPFFSNAAILPLQRSLFYKDALVFKDIQSGCISIKSDKTPHGLSLIFNDFPFLGIWNAKDADFVCIEPWCGIADGVDATGKLEEKEGINLLHPQGTFTRGWNVELF